MTTRRPNFRERLEDMQEAPGLKPQLAAADVPKVVGFSRYRSSPIISQSAAIIAYNNLCKRKPEYREPKFNA